jgi:hypothetical protein
MDISREPLQTIYECKLLASRRSLRAATREDRDCPGQTLRKNVGIMMQPRRRVKMQDFA